MDLVDVVVLVVLVVLISVQLILELLFIDPQGFDPMIES